MALEVGDLAPAFQLADQSGETHSLAQYRGKWVLLYFYPRDNTPGCTAEACAIRDAWGSFQKQGAVVLGVSGDSVSSHEKFSKKYRLSFPILSDPEKKVIKAYGAWGKKSFLGKTFLGIHRISFLIDPRGKVAKRYDKVKPAEHAQEVLQELQAHIATQR